MHAHERCIGLEMIWQERIKGEAEEAQKLRGKLAAAVKKGKGIERQRAQLEAQVAQLQAQLQARAPVLAPLHPSMPFQPPQCLYGRRWRYRQCCSGAGAVVPVQTLIPSAERCHQAHTCVSPGFSGCMPDHVAVWYLIHMGPVDGKGGSPRLADGIEIVVFLLQEASEETSIGAKAAHAAERLTWLAEEQLEQYKQALASAQVSTLVLMCERQNNLAQILIDTR